MNPRSADAAARAEAGLVKRGLLSRWEHALLVTDAEADAFVANPAAYGALIAERGAARDTG